MRKDVIIMAKSTDTKCKRFTFNSERFKMDMSTLFRGEGGVSFVALSTL